MTNRSLIEQKLWGNARIRAAENHCERMLTGVQFLPPRHRLIWMLLLMANVALVPFHQSGQGLIGG